MAMTWTTGYVEALVAENKKLRGALGWLLAMPHHNDEMGDCFGTCLHRWNDWPDEPVSYEGYSREEHDEFGGCVLVSFPGRTEAEWHDRNCEWVKALALLEVKDE